jgi:hypothetical protein
LPVMPGLRYTSGFCEESMVIVMRPRAASDEIRANCGVVSIVRSTLSSETKLRRATEAKAARS